VSFVILLAVNSIAQDAPSTGYDQSKLRKYFEESAQKYKITTESGEILKRREQASLTMRNDERLQDQSGSIFLWETNSGRPAAIIMIFSYWHAGRYRWKHELISVSNETLTAEYDGDEVWLPNEEALTFAVLREVPTPAATPNLRLAQMRQIARDFKGDLNIPGQPSSHLRLMPSPIHRYDVPSAGIVDGAYFSLAVDTDFEILLVLEARKLEDKSIAWNWAAARGHYHELILQRKDAVVWKAPRIVDLEQSQARQMPYARMPYFLFSPDTPLPAPENLK
jgi:hypothetical protein